MRYSITLIHGTWAHGARWQRSDSVLRETLSNEVTGRGHRIRYATFSWNGENSHSARRDASNRLADFLEKQLVEFPEDRHILLAHSHGGNVALQCLRKSEKLTEAVHGLVTLATPFIEFQERRSFFLFFPLSLKQAYDSMLQRLRRQILYLVLIGLFFPLLLLLTPLQRDINSLDLCSRISGLADCAQPLRYAFLAIACVVFALVLLFAVRTGYAHAMNLYEQQRTKRVSTILNEYGYFQPGGRLMYLPILSCSSLLDEARGVLLGIWWAHKLGALMSQIFSLGIFFVFILTAVGSFYLFLDFFAGALVHIPESETLIVVVAIVMMAFALALSATASAFFLRFGTAAPALGFGWTEANVFVRVRARRELALSPMHRNRRFSTRSLITSSPMGLFHSRLYASPAALRVVAIWICSIPDKVHSPAAH